MKNLVFNLRTAKAQAEGCAKVTKSSRMAKVLTTLTLLLTLCVGQIWAYEFKNPKIYFNNADLKWENAMLLVGHGSWSCGYDQTTNPISNTKLVYFAPSANWGDQDGFTICNTSGWDCRGDAFTTRAGYATHIGLKYSYNFGSGNTYYVTGTTGSSPTISVDYISGGYGSIQKYNATQSAKKRDTGTTYSTVSGSWPATLKLKGTYLSGDGTSAQSTIESTTSTDGNAKKVYGAVVTGEITHSYESLNSSYYFEGWGTGSTPSVTTATHSYNISANTTTYAFFSKKYTLTYDRKGTYGTSTLSASVSNYSGTKTSGSSIPTGHQITFTATPASGYVIEGWYSDAACTVSLENGQNTTYTISSLNANTSVYVKFEQLKTITIKFVHDATAGWDIQSVTKYPSTGGQNISADGTWVTMTFTNVYAVSNINLAYAGGGDWDYLNTSTKITNDCCYNKDGSLNASCCVPRANPTWGTAPASGAIGGSMTATVSGAPDGATITWTSTNTSAATVNSSGVISYEAAGNTTIKARVQKAAGGDYCELDYTLSQDISVTSGATVTATRTSPEYVPTGVAGQVSMHITFTGTSSGWKYRVKHNWDIGYETDWLDASGSSADWTMTGGVGTGTYAYVVELYSSQGGTLVTTSSPVSVTGEITQTVNIAAGAHGSVSPSGEIRANNNHVHPTITATPNEHYNFVNWTSNNAAASVANPNNATTTVTATAPGYTITANFAGDQYTITYKDQGGSAFSGTQTSAPTTHTYGTATTLKIPTKTGYTFNGWFTVQDCSSGQVGTASAASLSATGYTSNITLYAKWTEKLTTVTVNVSPASSGTLTVGGAAFTPGNTTTAGVTTSRTVVATAASDYTFDSWSVTGNATGTSSTNTYTLKGNGSAGTGTLTANFTPVPCSLMYGNATPLNEPTSTAMSYDATEHAYYKDITTNSSPFYFRFSHNDGKQYCDNWTSYPEVNAVTANDSKVACATETQVWFNKGSLKYIGESGTTIRIWFDYQNKKTWITADKDKQYVLRGANADDPSAAHGMPGWEATTSYFVGLASGNTGTVSCSLNAGEWYHLKVYDMYTKTWYGTSTSGAQELIDGTLSTMGSYDDFYFGTTVADSYTFTLDKSSGMKIKVDYPVSYQLNYDIGTLKGNDGDISTSPSTASGSYVPSGNTVTLTGPAPAAGYNWKGWYTNAAGTEGKIDDTNRAITVTMNADKTLYACYTEKNYTVTVTSGEGGYVASGSVIGHVSTKVTLPTATAYPGYRFVNWTTSTGSVTYTNQTSANTAQVNGLTAPATVRANFARTYAYIEGRFHVTNANRDGTWTNTFSEGNWDENSTSIPFAYDGSAHEFYLRTFATPKELSNQISSNNPYFYIKISTTSGSLSNTSSYRPYTSGAAYQQLTAAGEENKKQIITPGNTSHSYWFNSTDESGYVKLYFNQSYIWYWLEQTLEYNANGGTGDAPAAKTYYDKGTNATAGTNTFTRTGYHFNGWKTGPSSGTSYAEGASVTMNSNITLYAQWEAETYNISLDQQESAAGWSASGTATVPTVTYNAVLPAITGTMPTTTGSYGFMGFYTEPLGAGLRLTDGTGAWIADVDGYTDEDKKWIHAGDVTLYAYYKAAQITGITFSTGYVIAPSTSTTVTATIEPMPAVTTSLCWTVLHNNDNPLETQPTFTPASGTSVSFTTSETSATYKIVATLRTGIVCGSGDIIDQDTVNFQVAGDHTVTIQYKSGNEVIKASTTTTGRPLNWSDEITPPEIFGYTFSSWKAGDGVSMTIDGGETTIGTGGETTGKATTHAIQIKANYDGTLTANYTQKNYIYFKNTLNWSSVYINFYPENYWGYGEKVNAGSGNSGITNRNLAMTQIDDTDVWYYDYGGASIVPTNYVSFTEDIQEDTSTEPSTGYQFFWKANPGENVVYPARHMDSHGTDRENTHRAQVTRFRFIQKSIRLMFLLEKLNLRHRTT